jgi:glucose-1-phosphate thymidylyltransferase
MLPIYDKPMIYYPLSTLMLAGIREILVISTPRDIDGFRALLGDGGSFGLHLSYAIQENPRGLADAFIVGRHFVGADRVCLILGDNVFYGQGLSEILQRAVARTVGATIFGYYVNDPGAFGVVEFDKSGKVISIEEKPQHPKSNYAVPGLYFYDNEVLDIASGVQPSHRGEIEITAVNEAYLKHGALNVEILGRGFAWLDTGTPGGLLEASMFIEIMQRRQGLYVACLEEIAFKQGWISRQILTSIADSMGKTEYGRYLASLLDGETL